MINRRMFLVLAASLGGLMSRVFGKVRREPPAAAPPQTAEKPMFFRPIYAVVGHFNTATVRSMIGAPAGILATDVFVEYDSAMPYQFAPAGHLCPPIFPVKFRIGRLVAPSAVIDEFYGLYSDVTKANGNVLLISDKDREPCILTSAILTSISAMVRSNDMTVVEGVSGVAYYSPVSRYTKTLSREYMVTYQHDGLREYDVVGDKVIVSLPHSYDEPRYISPPVSFADEIKRMCAERRRDPSAWQVLPFPVLYRTISEPYTY